MAQTNTITGKPVDSGAGSAQGIGQATAARLARDGFPVIAHAFAFFAAPPTQFVTGQTLLVNGGKSLGGLGI